jgi:aminoglycoside phosphotransferase (APT) family kinase protein
MKPEYLGRVSHSDPAYGYFKNEIQPRIREIRDPDYRVFKMNGSNDVYLYEERSCGARFIGKFFLSARQPDQNTALRRLEREFRNLTMLRSIGFDAGPHYIARPLGKNPALNGLLVIEYCSGELLSDIINRSIQNNSPETLFQRLTGLAYFLSAFHNKTAGDGTVNFDEACDYQNSLIWKLRETGVLSPGGADYFHRLRERWRALPFMREDRQVLVHGDATPDNFLFGGGISVMSYDLERLRRADRIYDVGRMAAELAHFFMLNTGDRRRAEPFIGHFLWEYACHFPDRERAFESVAKRIPYYMGINLLRIARNGWLEWDYRRRLTHEAGQCLEG